MNKRCISGGIHIVPFHTCAAAGSTISEYRQVPRQAEVQRHHQIQFAVQNIVTPLHFFRLHTALLFQIQLLNTMLSTQQISACTHGLYRRAKQVRTPDEQVTRVVLPRRLAAKRIEPLSVGFDGIALPASYRLFPLHAHIQR